MGAFEHQLQKADRLSAITQQIGFAIWQIQELEGVTAQYLVLLTQGKKGVGLAVGNELVERDFRGNDPPSYQGWAANQRA